MHNLYSAFCAVSQHSKLYDWGGDWIFLTAQPPKFHEIPVQIFQELLCWGVSLKRTSQLLDDPERLLGVRQALAMNY